jgi:hypothetical protein
MPTSEEKPREAGIVLDVRVHSQMCPQLCRKLGDGAACLEAERTREGNEVVLPLVG